MLIEVGGKELLAGTDAPTLPVEVYGYAIDAQGSIVDYFTQTLGLEVARVRGQLEQSGVKYFGHLALPPGSYTLRVLVRNAITGKSRLAVLPLRVPAFSGEPGLAMPLVAEAQGKWLLIPASDRPDVAYPFMKGGDAFIPAARPQVPSSGETAVQLVAHNLSQVAVSGRALAADGREVPGVSVELGAGQQGGGQLSRLQTTLKTSGVPAGDYTLVVTVTDQATGRVETSSIPIRVG